MRATVGVVKGLGFPHRAGRWMVYTGLPNGGAAKVTQHGCHRRGGRGMSSQLMPSRGCYGVYRVVARVAIRGRRKETLSKVIVISCRVQGKKYKRRKRYVQEKKWRATSTTSS